MRTHETTSTVKTILTAAEVAALLGCTKRTLHTLTAPIGSLPVIRPNGRGGLLRYRRCDVEAWLEANLVRQDSTAG